MRRILSLLFVIVFATASEGPALCALVQPSAPADAHGCCGQQTVSPVSLQTCCATSQPDREAPVQPLHVVPAIDLHVAALGDTTTPTASHVRLVALEAAFDHIALLPIYLHDSTFLI